MVYGSGISLSVLGMSGVQEKEQALTGISEAAKRHIANSRAKRSLIYDNLLKEYRWTASLPSPSNSAIRK